MLNKRFLISLITICSLEYQENDLPGLRKRVQKMTLLILILSLVEIIFYLFEPNDMMIRSEHTLTSVSEPIELPKSLFWDTKKQAFYFIDIFTSSIHKYVPSPNEHTWAIVGDKPLSFVIPVKDQDDQFIISYGTDLALIIWDGHSQSISNLTILTNVDPRVENRINNGKTSPSGVLFLGSTGRNISGVHEKKVAGLYAYDNCEIKKVLGDVSISNGMAWSADENMFYYIDTMKHRIDSYAYDKSKCCKLGDEKTIFDYKANNINGAPDGMTIDAEGKLWVTSWQGYQVLRIDPATGKILLKIDIPASQVTSAEFGGPNLDDLYVTTGSYKLTEEELGKYPLSGHLFKITGLGIKGVPGVRICTK